MRWFRRHISICWSSKVDRAADGMRASLCWTFIQLRGSRCLLADTVERASHSFQLMPGVAHCGAPRRNRFVPASAERILTLSPDSRVRGAMPVTAKLSRKFYETFGDEIANELVEWFNRVDDTYRSEFRELFEVHFARFDAKLEQRVAEVKADLRTEMRAGFAELRAEMHAGFAALRGESHDTFATLRTESHSGLAAVRADVAAGLAHLRADLIKWMFIFWAGSVVSTVGLVFAVAGLLRR
jgi:hypothetical protein